VELYLHTTIRLHGTVFSYKFNLLSVISGANPVSYPMGTRVSLGVKWPTREADHLPPSSAEVKNAWSYISTPQYVYLAWCLVKRRDNFYHKHSQDL